MTEAEVAGPLHVVATAGHVDHGKSSLIVRLTGIDPDRWEEEKRRGLTIDLGYAWCTLPSGREVGFVDVPGHERFVRNMLAGVGPVRLVLFVVAADEGWKPQSEEHLAIVDVLGADGAVVALTKRDLVDGETLEIAADEVRERLAGTALEGSPVIACSSVTGDGIDDLRAALDAMVGSAPPPPQDERPRQFVDRVFTIRGAGTVITGTLTGGPLGVGQEVEVYPTGLRARIRGLQTHKRAVETARPVSRVAANLAGTPREDLERGDVVGLPGQWRPTSVFEARIRPIRGMEAPLSNRGAYKVYAGAAERDARIRFLGATSVRGPDGAYARVRLSGPLVLDVGDRFVVREVGRRRTVAGGAVLDPGPPARPGPGAESRLAARERAVQVSRADLPAILVSERGAVRAGDLLVLAGGSPRAVPGAVRIGGWWVDRTLHEAASAAVEEALDAEHRRHPLREGADLSMGRSAVAGVLEGRGWPAGEGLIDALLDDLADRRRVVRTASTLRLASHQVRLDDRREEVERLVAAVAAGEPAPPTLPDLVAGGFPRELVEAAARRGDLVRISDTVLLTPGFVERAEAAIREAPGGITVSAFRERLGTSRKYALPLLEWFDQRGVTVRRGDLRVLRGPPTG
jgi:selenocysteine-specific elongation factor